MSDAPDTLRASEVVFDPERILSTLARHHVEYVLIGGLASTPHGPPLLGPHAVQLEVFGIPVKVAALHQIIASKRAAGRPKDHLGLLYLDEILRQQQDEER